MFTSFIASISPRFTASASASLAAGVKSAASVRVVAVGCSGFQGTFGRRFMSEDAIYKDPNFPLTADGRVHHLDVKVGEVANRVLSVGDAGRAKRIASCFDDAEYFDRTCSRGFHVYTGLFEGVPVSVIATGMGTPMMDFVVRETRAIVAGKMAIVRYGSCGGLNDTRVGDVVVARDGAMLVRREPDCLGEPAVPGAGGATPELPYSVSQLIKPDATLTDLLIGELKEAVTSLGHDVKVGINMTTDSFYSSQGRVVSHFDDRNETLLQVLQKKFPTLGSAEMETFHLFDLARSSHGSVIASASAVALANRNETRVLTKDEFAKLEVAGGRATLKALAQLDLGELADPEGAVWRK